MAQQCDGQGPTLAALLNGRLVASTRLQSQFLGDLFFNNRLLKSTFPAEVYAAIKQDPGAVADAMAADILLAEDWESIGDVINAAGSNTRIATGMDAHADKQVDLHVRMRDGSVQVVNSLNPMTKAEFLAGAVKIVKITDTGNAKQSRVRQVLSTFITNHETLNRVLNKIAQPFKSIIRYVALHLPATVANQQQLYQPSTTNVLNRIRGALVDVLVGLEKTAAFDKQTNENRGLRELWKVENPPKLQDSGVISRVTLFSRADLKVVDELKAGSGDMLNDKHVQSLVSKILSFGRTITAVGTKQFGLAGNIKYSQGRLLDAEIKMIVDVYKTLSDSRYKGQEFDMFMTSEMDSCGSCLLAAVILRKLLDSQGVRLNIHLNSMQQDSTTWLDQIAVRNYNSLSSLDLEVRQKLTDASCGDMDWLNGVHGNDGILSLFTSHTIDLQNRIKAIKYYLETGIVRCVI